MDAWLARFFIVALFPIASGCMREAVRPEAASGQRLAAARRAAPDRSEKTDEAEPGEAAGPLLAAVRARLDQFRVAGLGWPARAELFSLLDACAELVALDFELAERHPRHKAATERVRRLLEVLDEVAVEDGRAWLVVGRGTRERHIAATAQRLELAANGLGEQHPAMRLARAREELYESWIEGLGYRDQPYLEVEGADQHSLSDHAVAAGLVGRALSAALVAGLEVHLGEKHPGLAAARAALAQHEGALMSAPINSGACALARAAIAGDVPAPPSADAAAYLDALVSERARLDASCARVGRRPRRRR